MAWLSLSIWVPIIVGVAVLVIGRDGNPGPARWLALIGSVLGLIVTATASDEGAGR